MRYITIYDLGLQRKTYLENAFNIGYSLPVNALWTASFSLPADDPKNEYCRPRYFAEIFDGDARVDLFRIIGEDMTHSDRHVRAYSCEHVLATLLDDVIFGYTQYGGVTHHTEDCLRYVLDRQTPIRNARDAWSETVDGETVVHPAQPAVRYWELESCDFDRQFEYKWENTNLLAALFSVPNCFDVEYVWRWDTEGFPWKLYLEEPSETLESEIRYGKNLRELRKTVNATKLANRIYALGYGEGVNQLTIASVNGGLPYVEDPESQLKYGLCPTVLVDRRFESAENLKSYALRILAESSEPYVSYQVSAVDLHRLTGDPLSRFRPGTLVRIVDPEENIRLRTRIIKVEKRDVTGDPGSVQITIANKSENVAGSIAELQNRALINDLYAQGATNQQIYNFSDNADAEHPATMLLYISDDVVRVNKVRLRVRFEPFRAFEKAAASYAQYSATSSGGGGSTYTSSGGGGGTYTSASGGGSSATSDAVSLPASNISDQSGSGYGYANHNHGIASGYALPVYVWSNSENGWVFSRYASWVPSGAHSHGAHSHSVTIPSHSHSVSTSDHSHSVSIPDHTHSVTIPAHSHSLEFGIYTGTTADSSQTQISVDDGQRFTPSDWSDVDITSMLGTDSGSGRISRGTWHEIKIYPDKMTRIVGAVFAQIFCSSRGGGDY